MTENTLIQDSLDFKSVSFAHSPKTRTHGLALDCIYHESCLDTMARMPDACIDMAVTSPPYDDMRSYDGNNAMLHFQSIATELFRVTKAGGVLVWIIGDQTTQGNESGTSFTHALSFKDIGFNLFDTMIYMKRPRGACGNNQTYWQAFEYMFVLSKGKPKTINLICDRENVESRKGDSGTKRLYNGTRYQHQRGGYGKFGRRTNVWQYNVGRGHSTKDKIAFEHPAIFPEALARDHILSWSNAGDIVYDPFMGSGTTAKACVLNKRYYIGSEINEKYVDIAKKRLACL